MKAFIPYVIALWVESVSAFDPAHVERLRTTGNCAQEKGARWGCDFSGYRFTIGADLSNANLSGANLQGAYLNRANLSNANLERSDLSCIVLNAGNDICARLWEADLRGARLVGANLTGAVLTRANLSGADLTNADLTNAFLVDAKLDGAKFQGAKLEGVIGLKSAPPTLPR